MRAAPLLAALLLAGCAAEPPESRDAVVVATASFDIEGSWNPEAASRALQSMGYDLEVIGAFGVFTKERDGVTVETQAPRAADSVGVLRLTFRVDEAEVCSTATYDEWVDALIRRLEPKVASQRATFEAESGWQTTPSARPWEVTASARDGTLLQFPDHCRTISTCADAEACEAGSRWQTGRPASRAE